MATLNDIKDSNFLTKEDCEPAIKVTVSHCVEENVAMANQPARMKYVVFFKELQKGMVLNLTNFQRIVQVSGIPDTDNWQGVQITLFNDPTVDFGGKLVGGIRVWMPQQQVVPVAPPSHSAPQGSMPPAAPQSQPAPQGPGVTNPNYVGDSPPPPTDDDIPY